MRELIQYTTLSPAEMTLSRSYARAGCFRHFPSLNKSAAVKSVDIRIFFLLFVDMLPFPPVVSVAAAARRRRRVRAARREAFMRLFLVLLEDEVNINVNVS